jgi:predicted transposase/invertase (TIGR01784 family)
MATTFINPFTDFGFKKIFGEEASKPHLIDFLNTLLPAFAQIKDLTFKNPEKLPKGENDRKAIYDIYCQGMTGEFFIVELQKLKQNFFKDRTLFYATFPIQEQAQKGDWDYRLEPIYCIGVLGFTFDDDKANIREVVHSVKLKDQNNAVFYDKLTFIYLEIPNFNKPLEALETRLDKWLFFIKNLEDLQSIPELLRDQVFTSAFETAKLANLEPREQASYRQSLKILRDNYATLKTAMEEATALGLAQGKAIGEAIGQAVGEARGREAGLTEGEARGQLKAKLEIAKNLKAAGLSTDQIQSATGLSAQELEQHGI